MILLLSPFVTNQRSYPNRFSRIDIFKYVLESYRKIPFTEVYLFVLLDDEFLQPGQYFYNHDITEYLYNIFSHIEKDKVHIVLNRYTSQDKWIPFFNKLMDKHGPNECVWLAQQEDHVFVDYNTDLLMEGVELLKNDKNQYKSLSYSHWPEGIKLIGKTQNPVRINNYVKVNITSIDGMQIFNLQFLYDIFVKYTWKKEHRVMDTLACGELLNGPDDFINNKLSQVIYIPLKELCRHFDGYDHVRMDRNACPPLELPSNTFNYSKDVLIKKMTANHSSYWTENNHFTPPQEWIDIMLSLHTIDEYTLLPLDSIIQTSKDFINKELLPIINNTQEHLEGNIFMYHLTKTYTDEFIQKQKNLILTSNLNNIKEILEIGFNSGFSALLFLNSNPNINITCVDIGEHSYTIPCYNKLKEFYGDRINLLIGNSVDVLPKLTLLFDLIHIDGAHIESIAQEDIINSYYLSKNDAIIIMDDYDINCLNTLWNDFSCKFNFKDVSFPIFENKYQSIKKLDKYNYLCQQQIESSCKMNVILKSVSDELVVNNSIPKIIHQIAPSDKTQWHPVWEECHNSWLLQFPEPEYEHKLWNDEDDLENLIKNEFPFFLSIFQKYPYKIQKIDMARYCILFKYGGIYADMDYFCYKNFYNTLDLSKTNIPYSPHSPHDILQNSLMATYKNDYMMLNIIDESIRRHMTSQNIFNHYAFYISFTSGPKLISDVFVRLQGFVNPLSKELYNPIQSITDHDTNIYNENTCYCIHFGTGKWE